MKCSKCGTKLTKVDLRFAAGPYRFAYDECPVCNPPKDNKEEKNKLCKF